MPWNKAQMKLFRAVAHGWKKPGGGGPSVAAAKKMEKEGTIKDSHKHTDRQRRAARRKKHLDRWARGD